MKYKTPLLARSKDFERKLPMRRASTQSAAVFEAEQKIQYMAQHMGVGPSVSAFAKKLGLPDGTIREALTAGAFTPKLLERIKKKMAEAGYTFSAGWSEWRDLSPEGDRKDTGEEFKAKFYNENRRAPDRTLGLPLPTNGPVCDVAANGPSSPGISLRPATVLRSGLDLWTPGQLSQSVFDQIRISLGEEIAQRVRNLSGEAIQAIGYGDFEKEQDVAERTIELGDALPGTSLRGEGYYLKGEALRLQADFAPSRARQQELRQEAEQFYGMAEDALHGDPRAIRGRARIIETEGRLDSSYAGYERALAIVEARAADPHEGNNLSLIHERIRTLRHKIVCLADIQKQALLPTLEAQRRAEDIKGFLARSEIAHHIGLKMFGGQGQWLCIEWFASCVLHAKGWAEIGEPVHAAKRLVTSLEARLKMIPKQGLLSNVELGNLRWWSRGAREVQGSFGPVEQAPLAIFLDAVDCGAERSIIHKRGLDVLIAGRPFWP